MDEGRVTPSRMLDARSKEPFAMDSLDSEITTSESGTFEAGVQSAQSTLQAAHTNENDEGFHNTDAVYRRSHVEERPTATMKGYRNGINSKTNYWEVNGARRDIQSPQSTHFDQHSSHFDYNGQENKQGHHERFEGEQNRQVEVDFSGNIQNQRGREEDNTNDQSHSHEHENRTGQRTIVRDEQESVESSAASKMLKMSESQLSVRKPKKRPIVSAETKARWAMLRTLAATGKDEVVDTEADVEKTRGSLESEKRSDNFEASAKEDFSSTNDGLSSFNKSSPQAERQVYPRKVDSRTDNRDFIRSSKAAVESALRRSGSGRRQSSRGEHAESESSISRAASVKRYMEKLRSDPHIDEMHLAALPTVVKAEGRIDAEVQGTERYANREGDQIETLSHQTGKKLERDGRQIKENVNRREHELRGDAQIVEDAVNQ